MADRVYISRDGDTVDFIAWRYYGRTDNHVVERMLTENQGLADHGPILPAGVAITLPPAPEPATVDGVRLWD